MALIFGFATLLSCGTWESYFKKESVHNTVARSSYKNDTLYVGFISFSAWSAFRNKNPNKIEIHEDTLWTKVSKAVAKLELPMAISSDSEYFELTDKLREFRTGTQFRDSLLGKLPPNKSWLVPFVEYTTIWDKQFEAGAASYTAFDTGRDMYSVYTRLHFAILKNDSLLYYSGHVHHDTLTLQRYETFEPLISQSVLDSLTVLTMDDYIKRLE